MPGFATFLLSFIVCAQAVSADVGYDEARSLYERELYVEAMNRFQSLPQYGNDPMVDGYSALCALKLRSRGANRLADNYLSRYRSSTLYDDVCVEQGNLLFDDGNYEKALKRYMSVTAEGMPINGKAAYLFKKGYCFYKTGDISSAMYEFSLVDRMPENDFSAPARYVSGYVAYKDGKFSDALSCFEKSSYDERFRAISNYYIINCHYAENDYDFVLTEGVLMFGDDNVPADRKANLARMISEAYLIRGDKDNAKKFFDVSDDGGEKSRADYFYAGSLMYAVGNYSGAIENHSRVTDRTDSLSQIAWYQTALSQVKTGNKVAALDAFKNASEMDYDPKMKEDALFNYAKLSFDLNRNTSVFADYMKTYSDKVRGEKIYSYMALTALADKDYQAAIDAYDKIEELKGSERNNYVNANYLRGSELLQAGSWRRASECFQAASYYTDKSDVVNQLSRYFLAESYFRDERYSDAHKYYVELYNAAALYGMEQGLRLPYNAAYCCFRQGNYEAAIPWFEKYCAERGGSMEKDAMLRKADCFFALGRYDEAVAAYKAEIGKYPDLDDLYPYCQCAVACGLVKDDETKLALLEKASAANPETPLFAEVMFELGKTRSALKKNNEAAETFARLAELQPDSPFAAKATLELGTIRRNSGDLEGALDCYKSVVTKMKSTDSVDDALLAIESIYKSQGQPQKYLAFLDSIGRGSGLTVEERESMVFGAAEQLFYGEDYPAALTSFIEFRNAYPESKRVTQASYFVAECYKNLNEKQKASDEYRAVIEKASGKLLEDALRNHAEINYSLENFDQAYDSYKLFRELSSEESLVYAATGMMRSAWKGKVYDNTVDASSIILASSGIGDELRREAGMLRARSLFALSRRDEALSQLSELAKNPCTAEGAEASYMLVKDSYDRADYAELEKKVFAFGESGTAYTYWLARSFVLLGDSYAEQGNMKKAKATFESIRDGYEADDEIASEISLRLDKLNEAG